MLITLHPDNPERRKINQIVDCLQQGGVIIYPTDSVYALGCDISKSKGIDRICQIKGIKANKSQFSFICHDLSHIATYTKPFSTAVYKAMRKHLPGPFTFILNASNEVPKLLKSNKKTVGIRVPDNPIALQLIEALGNPILSTSLKYADDPILEYPTDPYEIYEVYKNQVDIIIDGGPGRNVPSTVIDCSGEGEMLVLREGAGVFEP